MKTSMLRSLLGSFMSRGVKLRLCCVFCCMVATAHIFADCCSYTVPPGGYALIANQFNNGDTLASIFPNVPGGNSAASSGTQLLEWNCLTQTTSLYWYKTGGLGGTGWRGPQGAIVNAGTNSFLPGQGAIIENKTSTNYTYTICGTANSPVFPLTNFCGCGAYNLVSSQTNAPATYEDITGMSPQQGTQLFRYNFGSATSPFPPQAPNYTVYTYLGPGWTPSAPVADPCEPVWIYTPCSNSPCMVLDCPPDFGVECPSAWSFGTPSVLSSCCTNVTSVSHIVTNGTCPQFITKSWLFTDACGDSSICSQTVAVVNTNTPVITCPSNIMVMSCTNTLVYYTPTATNACCTNVTVVCSPVSGTSFSPGTTTVQCTAWDCCSNSASCDFTVTVTSDTNNLSCSTFDCNADGWTAVNRSSVTFLQIATGPVALTYHSTGGTGISPGYISSKDDGDVNYLRAPGRFLGNQSAYLGGRLSFYLENDHKDYVDQTPEEFSVILEGAGMILETSLLAPPTTWQHYDVPLCASVWDVWDPITQTETPASDFDLETVLANLTVIDIAGDFASRDDTTGLDNFCLVPCTTNLPPVIYCPAPIVVTVSNCTTTSVMTNFTVTAAGCCGCTNPPVVVCTPPSPGPFPLGTTNVHCVATDCHGNTAGCDFTVTVLNSGQSTDSTGLLPGFESHLVARGDDTSTNVPACLSFCYCGHTYSNLWINMNGNVTLDSGFNGFSPTPLCTLGRAIFAPFWADVDTRPASGGQVGWGCNCVYICGVGWRQAFGVTWRNVGYYSQQLNKTNSFQMLLIDRSDRGAGDFDLQYRYGSIQWDTGDASGGANGQCNPLTAVYPASYPARVGYGSTNCCSELPGSGVCSALLDGNASTGLINHHIGPEPNGVYTWEFINCQPSPKAGIGLSCATNKTVDCSSVWNFDTPTVLSTCCTSAPVIVSSETTNGLCPRKITRTWQVTDCFSNTATCSQTVTLIDNTPPVLTCASNKTVNCTNTWSFDTPTATDACCTNVAISFSTVSSGVCPQFITRTWQALDCSGNSATCSQTVTVVDTIPPVVHCPSNIVVTSCTATSVFYTVTATDACCSNVTIVTTPPSGHVFSTGTNTVNCVATDCCGNTAPCSFYVIVNCPSNPCPTNSVSLNTGYNHPSNVVYSIGANDAFWTVVADNDPATHEPRSAVVITRNPAWQPAQSNSQWIGSSSTGRGIYNGVYDFETRFCLLPGWTNVTLTICLRADDWAEVFLNGNPTAVLTTPNPSYNTGSPSCVTVNNQSLFVTGENRLVVRVHNSGGGPTGFNATGSVTGVGLVLNRPDCCQPGASISGQKFNDLNGNGVHDPGEPGLPDWIIELSNGQKATTDGNGYYYFMGLPPDTYTVTEVQQSGWNQTAPPGGTHIVTLGTAQSTNGVDFGNQPDNCLTTNVLLNTGYDPFSDTVDPIGSTTPFWTVVADPTGTITPRPSTVITRNNAWQPPLTNSQWISLYPSEQNELNGAYDFQSHFCLRPGWSNVVLSICLRADDWAEVFLNGNPILTTPNPSFNTPSPACAVVNNQSLFVTGANSLVVRVHNSGGVAMGLNLTGSLTGTGLTLTTLACCQPGSSISGQKYEDLNGNGVRDSGEPGLPGWTVQLSDGRTATTDINGFYYFVDLDPGAYTVTESNQTGWVQTAPAGGSYTVTLLSAQATNGLSFGNQVNSTNCVHIACASNVVAECTGLGGTLVPFTVTASSSCNSNVTVVCSPASPGPFGLGTTIVHCTATDGNGNGANCSFSVTVLSSQPVIQCPLNIVVSCTNALVSYTATATDACCSNPPVVVCTPPSPHAFPLGTSSVLCVATNCIGNTASCDFTVTVLSLPPVIHCPSNMLVSCTNTLVSYAATATSACCTSPPVVVCTPPSPQVFPLGSSSVLCVATDCNGYSNSCSFTVMVTNTPCVTPVISSVTRVGGTISISFQSMACHSYDIEYRNAMTDPSWTLLQTVPGTGGIVTVTDPGAALLPYRFYRVGCRE